jgi:hypothetical protein
VQQCDKKLKCDYSSCLVFTQAVFDKICIEKEKKARQDLKLQKILDQRLDKSSGASKKKYTFDPFSLKNVQAKNERLKEEKERSFKEELVRPCLCD